MVRPSVVLLAVLTSFSVGTSDALFEEDVPWLLAQRDAFFNWDVFFKSQSISGWDKTIPLCNWSCIECHTDAKDYNLEFNACTTFVADLSLQGTLAPELARCRSLYSLDLATVQVQGTLPADWGYPGSFQKLGLLTAVGNNITGTLPASWATPGAFPSLGFLWIDQNQLSGTLPPEWGAPGAFPKLNFLSVKKNLLSGTLPPEWALLPRLEYLWLGQNKLSGTLPEAWGQPNVFQKLTELQLDDTLLSGTLPAWDLPGAFPQLARMYLDSNRFVGTLPNWKRNGRFPKLAQLDIRLNPGFCGPVPPSLNEAICYQSDIDMCSMYGTPQLPPCSPPPRPALPPVLPPLLPTSPASLEPPPPTSKPSPAPPPLPAPLPPSPALPNPPSSPLPQSPAFPARPSPGPPVNDSVVGASLAPPPPAPPVDTSSSSVPIGAIVGAVAGAVALAALAFLAFRPGKGWLRNKAARGEAAAADGLESGCKGDLPDGPGGAVPAGIDSFLQLTSIKQQLPSLPGSGHTEPAFDTFIEAKVFQPEVAFLATEQQPVLSSLQSVASASRGPPTPPAGAAANTSAASLGASAGATPRAQLSGSSQPTGSSISSLEGDALLSIIASHLSSRQPAGQEALQLGPGSGDSAAAAAQLGSAVQGWEVAWGDIEVERLVGRGAFGMVYLGRWNELPVAVKVLVNKDGLAKHGLELPAGIMRALQQEASVMARMRHPHVVSFLGLCTVPPAILTEYCPRGSVYENLQEGLHSPEAAAELTWRRRLSMAHDAAMGLLYLHRRGLIHRDIKSPNLLVTENWRVQVSDFNLAKILGPAGSSSTSAGGPGNPQWLAPEVVQGGKASAASDVFSFGMVLLELLTWRLPWRDTPVWEIARQLREGLRPEVPPPNALPGQGMTTAPGLDAFCQLMRECWAQLEEARPTFADIVPRLRTLLEQA